MRHWYVLFAWACTGAGCAPAAAPESSVSASEERWAPNPLSITNPVEKFTLDNGLRVLLNQDRRNPLVAVRVRYGVGSADDPATHPHLAHLTEHLMFSGSANVPAGMHYRHLERVGASDVHW